MATSSTSAFELGRDRLIRRSYQVAGLLEASQLTEANDVSLAADQLQMIMDDLISEGPLDTWIDRTTESLVAGTAEYTLASDALDVFVDGNGQCGTIVPSSGAETAVLAITRADYIAIGNKATQATPSMCFVERLASVKIVFWPVPAATSSFRYQKIRIPRDLDTGERTLDLSRRWQRAIMYRLASALGECKSIPLDRQQYLEGKAERLVMRARESDVSHVPGQLFVGRVY